MLNRSSIACTSEIRCKARAGQMMVLLALLLPVLLGLMALAVDVGIFYHQWSVLQAAADAAALAGAGYLPDNPDRALTTSRSYAQLGGVSTHEITATSVGADSQTITISFSRDVSYYFGAVLGLKSSPVAASATGGLRTAGAVKDLIPVGIDSRTTYGFGQPITLIQGSSPYGPGNWGALALGGTGANNFEEKVINGYGSQVKVGDILTTETGKMTGPSKRAFDIRIANGAAADPSGTFQNHSLDDVRVATVPMMDFAGAAGRSQVTVLGFAQIWITSVDAQLNVNAIFIRQIARGATPGDPGGHNYGTYSAALLR